MAATFLSKIAADGGLSEADLIKFQTAVTEHLKSPTTRERLNEDIKKMSEVVMSIETCFAYIYYQMTRIDNMELLLDRNGKSIEFAPEWRVLHDEYTLLMMESQMTANKVSCKIDDLLRVVLPIVESEVMLGDKQDSINGYIKSLEMFQVEGQTNAARFSLLRKNVDRFRTNAREAFVDQQVHVGRKIKKLEKKIARLQADLESSSKLFTACWEVLSLSAPGVVGSAGATLSALGATASIAGTAGLSILAPAVGIGILVIGFISLGFSIAKGIKERAERRQAKIDDLVALQDEHEAAVFKAEQLKEILDKMHAIDTDFDQTISRLSTIQGIWNMLVTDAQRLSSLLSSLSTTHNAQVFEITARGLKVTYEMLQLALDQYSLAVVN